MAKDARKVAGAELTPASEGVALPAAELQKAFTHRHKGDYQVYLRRGERLVGEVHALKHVRSSHDSIASIVAPSGALLQTVKAVVGTPGGIDLIAPEDGVYGIAVTSGSSKGRLVLNNRSVCIAGPKMQLVGNQTPAYILPKAGADSIELSVRTDAPGEHVEVTFRSPDGAVVFSGNTRDVGTVRLRGDTKGSSKPWILELTNAIEDIYIELGDFCEPRLATHPDRLLKAVQP